MMPTNGTTEEVLAKTLTNETLAHRVSMLRDNRRAFSKAQADAFLAEASARLRWADIYSKHEARS